MNNVIVALASAPMKCALHIIRLSGEGVFEMTDKIFTKKVSGIKERTIFFGKIIDDGEDIDLVVLYAYPGPNTMTGEDVVEITCHGSVLIANEIIEAYLKQGATYATRGEFSSRAFFNGKSDLVEVEAVNDLINSTTKEAKRLSLMSLEGKTSKLVHPLKEAIAELLSLIEVNIDYPEYEDIEAANKSKISQSIDEIVSTIDSLISKGNEGKVIKEGVKCAIVGAPNVGKSSLLNALLDEDKAIVSPIPGTTRDIVEGEANYKGLTLRLLDTAGIREDYGFIEGLGIERSEKAIKEADLVTLLIDPTNRNVEEERKIESLADGKLFIKCSNKKDLKAEKDSEDMPCISALNKDIKELLDCIYDKLGISEEAFTSPSLNNARELGLLKKIKANLLEAKKDADLDAPIDFISVNLLSAYNGVREILGEGATLDLTDEIFSRFCVGK